MIYKDPCQGKEEKEEECDLGHVSYYYPPFNNESLMEPVTPISNETEESEMSLQEQMRETGMRGVPPMNDDCHSWFC